uniref:Uncharacterized protein NS7a n=1 Tax=Bat coronavirus Philippines/Diliman1525G2/2008 TaxID=702734 RepID=D2Z1E8_9BETC|nr:hypothetical protein [Bat coronavirus Philippines/Diliman1525G2/2008]
MIKLLLLAFVPTISAFTLIVRTQSLCVDSNNGNYCRGLLTPCEDTVVKVSANFNTTAYLCVKVQGVLEQDVGVVNVFTLVDPFGNFLCKHSVANGVLPHTTWGVRLIDLAILSKAFGDGINNLTIPYQCQGGGLFKQFQGPNVVVACIKFTAWNWDDTLKEFTLSNTPLCDIKVRPMSQLPVTYAPSKRGRHAVPIKDEL